jgi:Zn-dependent peptidase ImmA (M78 family)
MTSRPVIGFSTADPGDRQRHTLGHEIGHLVLHRGMHDVSDVENEASRFAGALLMPEDDAKDAFKHGLTLRSLAKLKAEWGISMAGLVMRASQVEAIDRPRLESLFKQISARGWRKDEPITVHREQPALLMRLLEARYGASLDWGEAAREIGLPPHLLRELACVGDRDLVGGTGQVVALDRLSQQRSNRSA